MSVDELLAALGEEVKDVDEGNGSSNVPFGLPR
jgi:hypothetical protein